MVQKTTFINVPGLTIAAPVLRLSKPYSLLSPYASFLVGSNLADEPPLDLGISGVVPTVIAAPTRFPFNESLSRDGGHYLLNGVTPNIVEAAGGNVGITLAAVVNLATPTFYGSIIGSSETGSELMRIIGNNAGSITAQSANSSSQDTGSASLPVGTLNGKWGLVMGTFTRTSRGLMVQAAGDVAKRVANTVVADANIAFNAPIRLGGSLGYTTGTYAGFNATYQWFGIYPRVLSAADFDTLYASFKSFNAAWGSSDVVL